MLSLLIYVFVTSITPGPSNLFMMNATRIYGFRDGKNFIFGILSGFVFLGLISYIAVLLFSNYIQYIETPLKYLGFIYLLYLSYKILTSNNGKTTSKAYKSFKSGFILQVLNMKSLLFFITLVGAFIIPMATDSTWVLIDLIISVFIGWACLLIWAFAGSVLNEWLTRHQTAFNIVMALLILYSAISIFI
ncbi:LysE family translocator [Staphylococcus pettenkoferi]|mgnify:FL=1|uniref:LysE family translocator n=2 Tax=Staphylococcus pettenkoferi TaxID=170573 RepID=UPI000CD2FB56|nr:LysE family translocator [Staphylococcus pettenkoferi]MCY1585457.1 LysE family translocator [Staphylococcus pettenkoferi]MCY1627021.1 LysE family translocator [Staphylococcus pettenkoferi]PNZ86779.1 LysE family translocator [Staphylococcus pettenkoferi]QQC36389.1 LysE family translocator [Staphylococcus pettenkoferi]